MSPDAREITGAATAEALIKSFTMNFGPQHPAAPGRIVRPGRQPIRCSPRPILKEASKQLSRKTTDLCWLLAKLRPAAPLPVKSSANPSPARSRRPPGKIKGRLTKPITSLPPSRTKLGRPMKPNNQSTPGTATNMNRATRLA